MSIPEDLYEQALAETLQSAGMKDGEDDFIETALDEALEAVAGRIASDQDCAVELDVDKADLLRTQCREQVEKMLTMPPGMQRKTAQLVFQHYWP